MLPQLRMVHIALCKDVCSQHACAKRDGIKVHFMCIYMKARVSFPGLSGIVAGVYFLSTCFSVF